MDGWMDGWVEAKAGLRIAYSNQKQIFGCLDFRSQLVYLLEKRLLINDVTAGAG